MAAPPDQRDPLVGRWPSRPLRARTRAVRADALSHSRAHTQEPRWLRLLTSGTAGRRRPPTAGTGLFILRGRVSLTIRCQARKHCGARHVHVAVPGTRVLTRRVQPHQNRNPPPIAPNTPARMTRTSEPAGLAGRDHVGEHVGAAALRGACAGDVRAADAHGARLGGEVPDGGRVAERHRGSLARAAEAGLDAVGEDRGAAGVADGQLADIAVRRRGRRRGRRRCSGGGRPRGPRR